MDLGRRGEDIALEFLLSKGMTFICRNARVSHKEVDLIFKDKNFIRFVEVKSRSYPFIALPLQNVNRKKQRNIIKAAGKMVSRGYIDADGKKFDLTSLEVAFDVICIIFNGDFYKLNYIQNAFEPNW